MEAGSSAKLLRILYRSALLPHIRNLRNQEFDLQKFDLWSEYSTEMIVMFHFDMQSQQEHVFRKK